MRKAEEQNGNRKFTIEDAFDWHTVPPEDSDKRWQWDKERGIRAIAYLLVEQCDHGNAEIDPQVCYGLGIALQGYANAFADLDREYEIQTRELGEVRNQLAKLQRNSASAPLPAGKTIRKVA